MFLNKINYYSAALLLTVFACGKKDQQQQPAQPPAVHVTLTEVTTTDASYYDESPGTVVPLNEIELRPQVLRHAGHGVERGDAAHIEPLPDLLDAHLALVFSHAERTERIGQGLAR